MRGECSRREICVQGSGLAPEEADAFHEGLHKSDGLAAAGSKGAGPDSVVHQDDRSRSKSGFHVFQHLGGRVPPPVSAALRPERKLESRRAGDLRRKGREHAPRRTPEPGVYPLATQLSQTVPDVGLDLLARLLRVPHVLRAVELNPVAVPENIGDQTREPPSQLGYDKECGPGFGSL